MEIHQHTLDDLEFEKVLMQIAEYSELPETIAAILQIQPYSDKNDSITHLNATNEYLSSFESENYIPYSTHFILAEQLKRIEIENYHLPAEAFLNIKSNCLQIKTLVKFFENYQEYFPTLSSKLSEIQYESTIVKLIDAVFNQHGEIKDTASPALKVVRKGLKHISAEISKQFNGSLQRNAAYLDEIRESVIDNIRVLAVKSPLRKRVKGRFLGTSKTGSISFIEPDAVVRLNRELEELKEEEKQEVIKILIELTASLAEFKPFILAYESFLNFLDFTKAKALYAKSIQAVLPEVSNAVEFNLQKAVHPILWAQNKAQNLPTISQDIVLNPTQRMIVISGPNAGGKSITLKTVGLLQCMIQSGILIPVNPKSKIGFFDQILTDIGDGQSIENQLSTYSYRLKQMSYFLRKAKENTLILIDEFGTGSDPELGGALAEVFFEEFYEKNCFGIFTTHYTNIKLKAEELAEATNACMLFDEKSLAPLYKLELGQAGSSFTFEVAEKNRIPYRLINRAKKKIEKDKVRLDKTILKLQQEKFKLQKTKDEIHSIKEQSQESKDQIQTTEEKIQQKLFQFQQLYDAENKTLSIGKKIEEFANGYLKTKNKKQLIGKFLKLVEMENAKKTPKKQNERKHETKVKKLLDTELKSNKKILETVRKQVEKQQKEDTQKRIQKLKVGDRVKLKDSNSVGTIEKIENETISINYGNFRAKVSIFEVQKI